MRFIQNTVMSDKVEQDDNVKIYKTLGNVQIAVKIYNRIRLAFLSLLSMDFAFFAFYLIFFITMQDNNWYDWMMFVEVFNMLAMIVLLSSSTDRIYQSLYYVMAASIICFAVNIIGVFAVRIPDINNATGNNTRRKDVKDVLLYMQISYTIYDFGVFVLAFYYRFLSPLNDDVLARFARISEAMLKYMRNAILYDMKETYNKEIALRIYNETDEKFKEQQFLNKIKTAVNPPPVTKPQPLVPPQPQPQPQIEPLPLTTTQTTTQNINLSNKYTPPPQQSNNSLYYTTKTASTSKTDMYTTNLERDEFSNTGLAFKKKKDDKKQ